MLKRFIPASLVAGIVLSGSITQGIDYRKLCGVYISGDNKIIVSVSGNNEITITEVWKTGNFEAARKIFKVDQFNEEEDIGVIFIGHYDGANEEKDYWLFEPEKREFIDSGWGMYFRFKGCSKYEQVKKTKNEFNEEKQNDDSEDLKCPKCGCVKKVNSGFNKIKKQRYKCKNCGCTYVKKGSVSSNST